MRKVKLSVVFVMLLVPALSSADFIRVGDKEWLFLFDIQLNTWDQAAEYCDPVTGACDSIIGRDGDPIEGLIWASVSDLAILFQALTPYLANGTGYYEESESTWAPQFVELFGETLCCQTSVYGIGASGGFLRDRNGEGYVGYGEVFNRSENSVYADYAAIYDGFVPNEPAAHGTIWFYRPIQVPEPSALSLFGLAFAIMIAMRRTRTPLAS